MISKEEELLIKECINWNRQAQNRLYKKFASKMFAVCFQYSKSKEEAEDTFHEGFMKVFDNLKTFKRNGSLEGWIRRIMVNTAIEKYRKNSHLSLVYSIDEDRDRFNEPADDDILSQIHEEELLQMIQNLPPSYKLVFNLYVFEGLMHKEIAERLNISIGTSKSNLYEAKAQLQKQIVKHYGMAETATSTYGRK